ncbi:hypothetical protein BGZ72_001271 [Mortierella alpina]|nr:hypothetical protein BGZ72_001271 [Mortierella alpina]
MWKPSPSPKAESPKPRWNPSTSPSVPIQRRPSSVRPSSRRLSARDSRDSCDRSRRALSLTPSAPRVRVIQPALASSRPRVSQDKKPPVTPPPAPASTSASPYASAASWFSFSSRIPFRLGSTLGQASSFALQSPRSPQTTAVRPLSSLNQVTSPMVSTSSSPSSRETPILSSGQSARYDPESDPYTMSTTSAASTISVCGSTDSRRELLMLMGQNVEEYVDRMSREARTCLYDTLPRLFRDCSCLATKMREDKDLFSSTTTQAGGLRDSKELDLKETEKQAQKGENDGSSLTAESGNPSHHITMKSSPPTQSEAAEDTNPKELSNQEEGEGLRLKCDTDSKEPSDVDMNQADPLEIVQENAGQYSPREASLGRSPKRMRQETEETTLRAKSTIVQDVSLESERVWTVHGPVPRGAKPAGFPSALSDASQGSCLRKRKRADDEDEGKEESSLETQTGHPSSTKVHLLLSEASDSDTSNATVVIDASMAGYSSVHTKESQHSATYTYTAKAMWQAADPTARGAKILAWNGELGRLILSFLECSTVIKIHFELQENARNQVAVPTSRLPVQRDSTMTLTAMSPPALETSLLPSTHTPSSAGHSEAQNRQHRRIARIRATADLNAIIRGGNDILDTIARYESCRSDLMEDLTATVTDDRRAALRSSLHTLDYRHFSRLQLCTLELEASVVGLFRTLRMTI